MLDLNEASGWTAWENIIEILLFGFLESALIAAVLVIIVSSLSNR